MPLIKRQAQVHYSQQQMFELVNHIENYSEFLPWCRHSQILTRQDHEIEAEIQIAWSGLHKNFTTKNTLHPNERIEMHLVKGPFHHLDGVWEFIALGESRCEIQLVLDFEFSGGWIDKLFQPVFHHIANSLVDAFCQRAAEIYGKLHSG